MLDVDEERNSAERLKRFLIVIAVIACFLIIFIFSQYFIHFNPELERSGTRDEWGVFGDFIGGVLNPLLAFLSFMALLVTITLQQKELILTREEMKQSRLEAQEANRLARDEFSRSADALDNQSRNLALQRFENTFFQMLDYYEQCRDQTICKRNFLGGGVRP